MSSSYQQAVEILYRRINYERLGTEQYSSNDLKLERMGRLLEAIGNPQQRIPVVHVAGTKGKGTTCAYLACLLQQTGRRVGLYTSPHMYRVEERFTVNGVSPSEEVFVQLVHELVPVLERLDAETRGAGPTFFECVNALAWMHFEREQVDLAVLEVGLGGRLDSTNLCSPLVTAITSISFDHTRILGNTLEQIAGEKAGIIKRGVPVVCGVDAEVARERIHRQAVEMQAPVVQWQEDFAARVHSEWSVEDRRQSVQVQVGLRGQAECGRTVEFTLAQPGPVYAQNAAIALACVHELERSGITVSDEEIRRAMEAVELPLRFEILSESPLLIVDAAHNPASLRALVQNLKTVFPGRRLTFLLAVSRDKDYAACCRELAGVERVIVSSYQGNERALNSLQLQETLEQNYSGEILSAAGPAESLQLAGQLARPEEVLVATGSLFFAAEVRQLVKPTAGVPVVQDVVL